MQRQFDNDLKLLKDLIIQTGAHVEDAIREAVDGLLEKNTESFARVLKIEEKINQAHIKIDDDCVRLLARQSPLAGNLRFIVAVIKMNTDLERMGDLAVTISHHAKSYINEEPLKPLIDIPKMALEVREMVHEALVAFMNQDLPLAQKVLDRDDTVDNLKAAVLEELTALIEKEPQSAQKAIGLILIAKNLERIGDHATNIVEDAIFVSTGKDIRHGGR